jgi:decaprenylphospho-beta-D-erythro-pentofuranosid-2-ulose 2-reductase
MLRVAFLGATKGIGRALARLMVERGDALFLLGRTSKDLESSARDLEVRGEQSHVCVGNCDLEQPGGFASALDEAEQRLGGLDAVVVTAALFGTQEQLESSPPLLAAVLNANFTGTILFCEEARRRLLARGGGVLCVFSSVAGERGRKPAVLYGATKAGLSRYLEGLDHRYHASGLRVVCVKPGFVKTSMTAGLSLPPFAGEPDDVARVALRAIDRGTPVVYAPAIWRWIMLAIRCVPRFVMRRAGF